MSKTIFELLNDIHVTKIPWKEQSEVDRKQFSVFMINRWLSMKIDYLDIVAETQKHTMYLDPSIAYEFYRDLLPKQKFFVKYVSAKSDKEKEFKAIIQLIAKQLMVSEAEAEEYLEILNPNEMKTWLTKFGYNDKELSRIFKISSKQKNS